MTPVERILARAAAVASAIHAIPETESNYRELRRAITEADALARDAAALGEPVAVEAGGD